ncbi:unnamed protein product [Cunninghamella blakesleeana]
MIPRRQSQSSATLTSNQYKVYIAANLYNNENIIYNWTDQIKKLIQYFGENNIYVSIYENGSTDNTKKALKEFKEYLLDSDVHHTILTDDKPAISKEDSRILQLSKLRNIVLNPLRKIQQDKDDHYNNNDNDGAKLVYDKILFLNDIWFNWKDAVELIYSNNGDYDAVCSMDFYGEYYDMFATREINGQWLGSGQYPYFEDLKSRQLLKNNELIPVYSCFGGMVSYNPIPFLMKKKGDDGGDKTSAFQLNFRPFWLDHNPNHPLDASECCLIYSDMRKMDFTNIYINPKIKVAYDHFHYIYAHYILPLWQPYLNWFNTPVSMTKNEEILWSEKLKSLGPIDQDDAICLWRPAHY